MAKFTYRAKDQKGGLVEGQTDAESPSAAISQLQAMGYFPLDVKEVGGKRDTAAGLRALRRPRVGDIAAMYRQMADLVGSGIPLVRALSVVSEQTPNEQLRQMLGEINSDVSGGDSMAQAMGKHPKVFPRHHRSMIRAGETGGMLAGVLERLADFAEQEEELRSKIWSSLAYPLVMIVAGGLAVGLLVTVVIPRIVGIFSSLDQSLPFITLLLIGIIEFFERWWWLLIGTGAAVGFGLYNLARSEEGRLTIDRTLLRMPLIGTIILKREIGKFARTLGSLLANGVTILTALDIVTDVIKNRVVQREIAEIPQEIAQGEGISKTLAESTVFPPVVVNMIAVGEETGHLDTALLRIADSHERQVDRALKTLTSLIEPLIIVVMAGLVGFLVIAMLLPIFSIEVGG
jgi:type II secretion system protein F